MPCAKALRLHEGMFAQKVWSSLSKRGLFLLSDTRFSWTIVEKYYHRLWGRAVHRARVCFAGFARRSRRYFRSRSTITATHREEYKLFAGCHQCEAHSIATFLSTAKLRTCRGCFPVKASCESIGRKLSLHRRSSAPFKSSKEKLAGRSLWISRTQTVFAEKKFSAFQGQLASMFCRLCMEAKICSYSF